MSLLQNKEFLFEAARHERKETQKRENNVGDEGVNHRNKRRCNSEWARSKMSEIEKGCKKKCTLNPLQPLTRYPSRKNRWIQSTYLAHHPWPWMTYPYWEGLLFHLITKNPSGVFRSTFELLWVQALWYKFIDNWKVTARILQEFGVLLLNLSRSSRAIIN